MFTASEVHVAAVVTALVLADWQPQPEGSRCWRHALRVHGRLQSHLFRWTCGSHFTFTWSVVFPSSHVTAASACCVLRADRVAGSRVEESGRGDFLQGGDVAITEVLDQLRVVMWFCNDCRRGPRKRGGCLETLIQDSRRPTVQDAK